MAITLAQRLQRLKEGAEAAYHRYMSEEDLERAQEVQYIYQAEQEKLKRGNAMPVNSMGSGLHDSQLVYGTNPAQQAANNHAVLSMAAQQNAAVQNTLTGIGPAMAQQVRPAEAKEGVLMWQGRELPEDWRGAEYTDTAIEINAVSRQHKITFRSKWSSDSIMLWLSTHTYSGAEAMKVAATFLEVINQRRISS